ncbi:MAG: site-2 protease family protein [Pirellulaceae bacterium]
MLGFVAFQSRAGGYADVAFSLIVVLSVFLCVTLHEYGHALAARRFGIGTVDITLLPIGGVARLERMPREPWKELVVAVAGPAVNVVIAAVLLVVLLAMLGSDIFTELMVDTGSAMVSSESVVDEADAVTTPAMAEEAAAAEDAHLFGPIGFLSYVYTLALINVALVVFNMIPAFPMDGGRVLRSILAMTMSYAKATFIASRIGLVCAAGMAVLWFMSDQQSPVPILIAMFIAYAGMAEAKQVEVTEAVRGLIARDVMIQAPPTVSMDTPLSIISANWQSASVTAMPVVSIAGTVVGILKLSAVSEAVQKGVDPATTAGQMADHNVAILRAADKLEDVLPTLGRNERHLPVVDDLGLLVGLLDLDSLRVRAALIQQ